MGILSWNYENKFYKFFPVYDTNRTSKEVF